MFMIVMAISLPGVTALAQPDEDPWDTIPVHPGVTTVLRFPDEVEGVRVTGQVAGLIRATTLGDKVLIRPQRGAPAWDEVSLQVKTATVRVRFRLRLTGRARDASRHVVVVAEAEARAMDDPAPGTSEAAPGEPAASAPAGVSSPEAPEPAASVPSSAPLPPEPSVSAGAVTTEPEDTAAAGHERDAATTSSPRFEISVHAVAALMGTTELAVAGYQAIDARQSHRAFGMRVAGSPHDAWWAVEANVSGEWLAAPTAHVNAEESIAVSGRRLRADVGIRARFRTRLSPTAYAGIGLQAHHRDLENGNEADPPLRTLPRGGVLALGLGLEYRAGDLLLGLELHMRQGVPADYYSVAALLSVGLFLDQGE